MSTRYKDLPEELKGLVIELTLTNARKNGYLNSADAQQAMDTAAAILAYGQPKADETNDDEAVVTETSEGLATTGKEHCGNPDCTACNLVFGEVGNGEPIVFDPAKDSSSDFADALALALSALPKQKPRFTQIDKLTGAAGDVHVYQARDNDRVFAISCNGKTAIVEGSTNKFGLTYNWAIQIIEAHGSERLNIA